MLSSSAAGFLTLPPEVRILIYHAHLTRHRQVIANAQPNNSHLRILRTCRTVSHEAREILQTYISLRYERQIHNFIHRIATSPEVVENIIWADVANDGRFANAGRNNAEVHHDPRSITQQLLTSILILTGQASVGPAHCNGQVDISAYPPSLRDPPRLPSQVIRLQASCARPRLTRRRD
jgi:hypothetical protein